MAVPRLHRPRRAGTLTANGQQQLPEPSAGSLRRRSRSSANQRLYFRSTVSRGSIGPGITNTRESPSRSPGHRWTANDIHDIDAVSSTIPYCDVVVTDRAVAAHAQRTGLAERLGTAVLARLSDVVPLVS